MTDPFCVGNGQAARHHPSVGHLRNGNEVSHLDHRASAPMAGPGRWRLLPSDGPRPADSASGSGPAPGRASQFRRGHRQVVLRHSQPISDEGDGTVGRHRHRVRFASGLGTRDFAQRLELPGRKCCPRSNWPRSTGRPLRVLQNASCQRGFAHRDAVGRFQLASAERHHFITVAAGHI